METDPEARLEQSADELEQRVEQLGDHIDEAKQAAAHGDAEDGEVERNVGDYEEVHDESGGQDPAGAGEDKDDPVR